MCVEIDGTESEHTVALLWREVYLSVAAAAACGLWNSG